MAPRPPTRPQPRSKRASPPEPRNRLNRVDRVITSGTFSLDGGTILLTLPANTLVLTGHGSPTTVGAEGPRREEWIARGH